MDENVKAPCSNNGSKFDLKYIKKKERKKA